MKFTPEHDALRRTTKQFVDSQINPFVDEWEEAGIFPAHELFRKMGELGLLGVCKPEENGGMGLDYSYNMV
ncbi:MAG TPA: acyl-CoA dehydrogenase family protein, partial [Agitococcus sp.]|nr:acyl-CoA dehydrogenase family protein [Agitococcus sp.]